MSTIKEIAKAARVSTATVSNVLNNTARVKEETRQVVLKAVEELNYTPNVLAKGLKMNKSHTIGIITEDITVFNTPEIVNGIDEYMGRNNYYIVLYNLRLHNRFGYYYAEKDEYPQLIKSAVNVLLGKQIDGIIYIGANYREIPFSAKDSKVPMVYAYCYNGNEPSVGYDDETVSYELASLLIRQGHRQIGLIAGSEESICTRSRMKGFQKALYESQILFDPNLVKYGDWTKESGYRLGRELLSHSITAVWCMNDNMAAGVYDLADHMNLSIPGQLSVVGFDNRESSWSCHPKLTTVDLPLNQIGKRSAEYLLNILNTKQAEPDGSSLLLPCRVVERQSVSFPRHDRSVPLVALPQPFTV